MDASSMTEVVQAANFVTGSVLVSLGLVVIVSTILVINNLFTKFWKPIRIFTYVVKQVPLDQVPPSVQQQYAQHEPAMHPDK